MTQTEGPWAVIARVCSRTINDKIWLVAVHQDKHAAEIHAELARLEGEIILAELQAEGLRRGEVGVISGRLDYMRRPNPHDPWAYFVFSEAPEYVVEESAIHAISYLFPPFPAAVELIETKRARLGELEQSRLSALDRARSAELIRLFGTDNLEEIYGPAWRIKTQE